MNSMGSMSRMVKCLAYNLYQIFCLGNSLKENLSMLFQSTASFPSFFGPNRVVASFSILWDGGGEVFIVLDIFLLPPT